VLDKSFAREFAADWIESWNSHDLDRVLAHYTDDFQMSSPLIAQIAGEPSGKLKGKKAVGAYWAKAMSLNPNLHFELANILVGAHSVTIYYKSSRGMSAEVLVFGEGEKDTGKVVEAFAHYAANDSAKG